VGSKEIIVISADGENEPTSSNIVSISPALTSATPAILSSYTAAMPKFDFSALMPAFDVASLIPTIDTSAFAALTSAQNLLPKMDSLVPALNIASAMPAFDYSSIMPTTGIADILRIQESMLASMPDYSQMLGGLSRDWLAAIQPQINFAANLQPIFDMLRSFDWESIARRQRIPANWPDDFHDKLPALVELVNEDGIPATWVPRAEVLDPLLAASSGEERSEVLIHHRDDILDDCAEWLDDLTDPLLDPVLPIAREVLDACRRGLWKVGAISAVQVVHSIVESLHWVSDRQRVAKHHILTVKTPFTKLLEQATRAPLILFYDDWNPLSGKPRPTHLTRHVVSHRLGEDQVSERNCIVAVMLMASLIVTVYQLDLGQREIAA
jgi:hypothetical protein